MLRTIICLVLCITIYPVFAQQKDTTYFSENFITSTKANAAFYRVSTPKDSLAIFSFTEYRSDGSYVLASAKDNIIHPRYIGFVKLYNKQGQLIEAHEYDDGILKKTMRYNTEAKLQQTIIYKLEKGWPYERLLYETDSIGNPNIINGTGTRNETGLYRYAHDTIVGHYTMTGQYKSGVREGEWSGTDSFNLRFKENYHHGKLTSGKSVDANGKTHKYSEVLTVPDFQYQRQKIEREIKKQLVNPTDTLGLQRLGKRSIYIDYTVDATGITIELTGFKPDGTSVALPLVHPYKGISPATVRGLPISYRVTHNYSFGYGKPYSLYTYLPYPLYLKPTSQTQN